MSVDYFERDDIGGFDHTIDGIPVPEARPMVTILGSGVPLKRQTLLAQWGLTVALSVRRMVAQHLLVRSYCKVPSVLGVDSRCKKWKEARRGL